MHTPATGPCRPNRRRLAAAMLAAAIVLTPAVFEAQLDICGCGTIPNLPVLDSTTGTYPAGTVDDGGSLTIATPPDGIIRLSSLRIHNRHVFFARNALNTPIVILVAGDATFSSSVGCCWNVHLSGAAGSGGSEAAPGLGGLGAAGGFRGGDGASMPINSTAIGGTGFGPGGGAGGTGSPLVAGSLGSVIASDLIPLIGGSGGGGGGSANASAASCSGGGGGGGGGALLIAANATLTLTNYQIFVDGGGGAGSGNGACASSGAGGAAGSVRLVANRLAHGGIAQIFARTAGSQQDGHIRLESVDLSSQTAFSAFPPARRFVGPTPLVNPVTPTISVVSVGGNAVPVNPQGTYGAIDIVLNAPGAAGISVATSGVPSGTGVAITVKPRSGAAPVTQNVPVTGCDGLGNCQANATFDLAAGAYVVEARATFQIP